ncbi:MAG: sigma-70 family RNA polymerase sigma factor [Gemmatimonadetes bacterium]|nr:sigma-70 family RNA polymerase sigma factor [Gemmatimonadota bacterium]NNM05553.1 sigma-70 family RNA polymerase sigma factor [Gemmatimonadota bacterium]
MAEVWRGLSTSALVERAQSGDSRAFEALYRRLVGRIYALCLRMARDAQRAEELTQDVFVRAWERLGTFRGESKFTTWLHRLAVNVVLQAGRTKGRRESREELVEDPGEYLGRVKAEFPGTKLDIERAIASLPDGARTVVILRDIYGYKYDEIAEMQGVALGTVKAQIHRARKMIREKLDS